MTSIHAHIVFDSPSARQKAVEAEQIASDLERFRKAGGKVQVLGNTPIDRSSISRRQVVEGGAEQRKAAKGGRV